MNEIETVQKEVMPISGQAMLIIVKDQGTLVKANEFFLIIDALKKKIAATFDPMEEAAKEAKRKAEDSRKTIVLEREKIEAPLNEAKSYLSGQVISYKREQDRIREVEEECLRQEAIRAEMKRREKEEREKFAQAIKLEKAGATEEAEALIAEAIEEKERPIEVTVAPPQTLKIKLDGATVKGYWHAEVTDLRALCKAVGEGKAPLAYVDANMPTLNTLAKRLMKELAIPGVKAVSTSSMAATGKRAA